MSNVLMGFIGIILFIGLAYAATTFLGDYFASSANSAKAATYISQTNQVARAITMYELKTGQPLQSTANLAFLVPRYLKTLPENLQFSRSASTPAVAFMTIPKNAQNAKVCEQVQRQTGIIRSSQPFNSASGTIPQLSDRFSSGCRDWDDSGDMHYVIWTSL